MAIKSFTRNIVIKDATAIKMIKDEIQKSEFANFSTGIKLEKMSNEKAKKLNEQLLRKFNGS